MVSRFTPVGYRFNPMRVLGVNAVFHDPAAALVVDGRIVAAAEEERFTRRKHGKPCVPFSTWELPEQSARWALRYGGITPAQLDAVAYSYDPDLAPPDGAELHDNEYEALRTYFVRSAPGFLATLLPGLDRASVRYVPHHVAHAASAYLGGPVPRLRRDGDGRPRRADVVSVRRRTRTASSRCCAASRCRTRSACATKS